MRSMNRLKWHVIEALTEMSVKLIGYHLLQAVLKVIEEIALVKYRFVCASKSPSIMIFDS